MTPPDFSYAGATTRGFLMRLAGHSAIYGLLGILVRLGNLLLLPLYWRHIEPAGFGILGIAELLNYLLLPCLTLSLDGAVMRFYHEWPISERRRRVGAAWTLSFANALAWGLLLLAVGAVVWPLAIRSVVFMPYVAVVILSLIAQSVYQVPLTVLRIQERSGLFMLATLASFLASAGVGVYFVVVRKLGIVGLLYGNLAGHGLVAIGVTVAMSASRHVSFSWSQLRSELRYALPLLPSAVLMGVPRFIDRFFLDKFVPLAQVGFYSIANSFGNAVLQAQVSLKSAWFPMTIRLSADNPEAPRLIAQTGKYFVATMLGISLAVAMLGRDYVTLSNAGGYLEVRRYIPVFALIAFVSSFDVLSYTAVSLSKRTAQLLGIAVFQALLGIALIGWGAWKFGILGALVGTLIVRTLAAALFFVTSHRAYPVRYPLPRLLAAFLLAVGCHLAGCQLEGMPAWAVIGAKVLLLLTWGMIVALVVLEGPITPRRLAAMLATARATGASPSSLR